jgi:1,4-dihydroxy-2-naphthoate octaprenyltransferase
MAWVVYTLGAVAAYYKYGVFDSSVYWLGYLVIFLIKLNTVLINEYNDLETDKHNQYAGPFTGGSRILVKGEIEAVRVKTVVVVIFVLICLSGFLLLKINPGSYSLSILCLLLTGVILGPGYTMPPIKLCYRSLGELTVGVMFSPFLIISGYTFQSGRWHDPLPWLLSIPLFFAILAPITLSAVPDSHADRKVDKKTLAVRLGPANAVRLSAGFVVLAALSWGVLVFFETIPLKQWALAAVFVVFCHAAILLPVLMKLARSNDFNRRIDSVMLWSLAYIAWFGLIPLLVFWIGT